ncbi:MAG: hypothetical protein IT162_11980 [Bryobacterales bacterium]|nr:hypothetical protein [Bryobacterales bacterium]
MKIAKAFVLASLSAPLFSQNGPINFSESWRGVIGAYENGVRLRLERERIEMDRQIHQEQLRLLQSQREQQREFAKNQQENSLPAVRPRPQEHEGSEEAISREIDVVFGSLQRQYADFRDQLPVIAKLAKLFRPYRQSTPMRDYVESIYLLAKNAALVGDPGESAGSLEPKCGESAQQPASAIAPQSTGPSPYYWWRRQAQPASGRQH